jgi:hypothetical protein
LRRVATPENKDNNQEQEAPAPKNPKNPSKSDNRQPHDGNNQNSSRDDGPPVLAAFPAVILAGTKQARLNRRTA